MIRVVATGIPENAQGAGIALEFVIEFLRWADGVVPEPVEIMDRFGVSRATAYRYQLAYRTMLEKYGSLKFERKRRAVGTLGVDGSSTCA